MYNEKQARNKMVFRLRSLQIVLDATTISAFSAVLSTPIKLDALSIANPLRPVLQAVEQHCGESLAHLSLSDGQLFNDEGVQRIRNKQPRPRRPWVRYPSLCSLRINRVPSHVTKQLLFLMEHLNLEVGGIEVRSAFSLNHSRY